MYVLRQAASTYHGHQPWATLLYKLKSDVIIRGEVVKIMTWYDKAQSPESL